MLLTVHLSNSARMDTSMRVSAVHANALHQPLCCSAEHLPQQNAASSHVAAAAAAGAAAAGGGAAFSDCGDAGGLKKLCCRAVTALMRLSGSYAIICRNSSTCAAMAQ